MAGAPGSITSYNIAPGQSAADLDYKRKIAYELMKQGMDAAPVQHWTQGLARMAQGALGGYELYNADQEDQKDREKTRSIVNELMNPQPSQQPAPVNPTQSPMGSAAGDAIAASPDASMPRGFRNSNPGNIEDGPFARSQPGYVGSDGRFAKFASMEHGTGAMNALLDSYEKRGVNTIDGVINRWAPSSDGNNTQAYVQNVARQAGLDPSAPITPDKRQAIIAAMAQHENGKPLPQSAPVVQGGAPVGAPIDQPRGGLTGDRRSQLIQQLASTRAGAPFAQSLLAKQLEQEATRVRPLTDQEKQTYPGAVAVKASGEPIFPPPSTNVQLSTVANPVLEGVGKQIVDQRKNAQVAATETIPAIHDARNALDEGVISGAFAQGRMDLKKVGALFGINDNASISNTELLRASVGKGVLANIKALGANPSNADRVYIEKVQAGDINLEEGSIRKMLDIQEKYSRQAIKSFNADSKKLVGAQPDSYKGVAPLMSIDEPAPYSYAPKQKPVTGTPQGAPDRSAIEQEMRRRGLIK